MPVFACVVFRRFVMMMFGVEMVAVGRMRVMRSFGRVAGFVMLSRLLVMMGCMLMVFGRVLMMLGRLLPGHRYTPLIVKQG